MAVFASNVCDIFLQQPSMSLRKGLSTLLISRSSVLLLQFFSCRRFDLHDVAVAGQTSAPALVPYGHVQTYSGAM